MSGGVCEASLDLLCFFEGFALCDLSREVIDEVTGFFESDGQEGSDLFDDGDAFVSGACQDDFVAGDFGDDFGDLGGGRGDGFGADSPFLFQGFHQLAHLQNGELAEGLDEFLGLGVHGFLHEKLVLVGLTACLVVL